MQALSYLGHTPYGVKEDAFFCYATARLAGFVWNGGCPSPSPRWPRSIGFGWASRSATKWRKTASTGGRFEAGLVAVNPDRTKDGFITVKPPIPTTRFYDVFGERAERLGRYGADGYRVDRAGKARRSAQRPSVPTRRQPAQSGLTQAVELNQDEARADRRQRLEQGPRMSRASPTATTPSTSTFVYKDGTSPVRPDRAVCLRHARLAVPLGDRHARRSPSRALPITCCFRYKSGKAWFDDVSLEGARRSEAPREVLAERRFRAAEQPRSDG